MFDGRFHLEHLTIPFTTASVRELNRDELQGADGKGFSFICYLSLFKVNLGFVLKFNQKKMIIFGNVIHEWTNKEDNCSRKAVCESYKRVSEHPDTTDEGDSCR